MPKKYLRKILGIILIPAYVFVLVGGNAGISANHVVLASNTKLSSDYEVVPGGQSIGVQLNSQGVLVVGYNKIDGESPSEAAGIKVGDIINEINGCKVSSISDISEAVRSSNVVGEVNLVVLRDTEKLIIKVVPKNEKLGLFIRDSAAGIGTLTFMDAESKNYGALGHVISDPDSKTPIKVEKGAIYRSNVTAIDKGENGSPGEKQAQFTLTDEKIGDITSNTDFGIFGKMDESFNIDDVGNPIPIASMDEVREGAAEIYTVVDGNKVEKFDVEIVSSKVQDSPSTKGLILKITDPELLEKTGGIVQGMSGSPIIQDGKLIGAITHVFVHDPTTGYGVHIEWMLDEIGVKIN